MTDGTSNDPHESGEPLRERRVGSPAVPKRLYRDPRGPIGGVAGGLAGYFDLDPVLVRLLWVLAMLSGVGVPGYIVCWVVVPKAKSWPPPGYQSASGAKQEGVGTIVSGLLIVALAALIGSGFDGLGDLVLPAALLGFGVYLLNQRASSTGPVASAAALEPEPWPAGPDDPAAAEPRGAPPSAARPEARPGLVTPTVLSSLALLAGLAWALDSAGVLAVSVTAAAAGGLVVIGLGLCASLWLGPARGLIPLGIGLGALMLIASSVGPWLERDVELRSHAGAEDTRALMGEHVYRPASLAELEPRYRLGIGELTLDLSQLDLQGTSQRVDVDVRLGEATVIVPPETSVEVQGHMGLGEATIFEHTGSGMRRTLEGSERVDGAGTLLIDLEVGIGEVTVRHGR